MGGKDKNLILIIFLIVAPSFKVLNNSQKFFIVSFILDLSKDHFPGEKSYYMPLTNFENRKIGVSVDYVSQTQLTDDFTNSKARYVSFNLDMMFWIKIIES